MFSFFKKETSSEHKGYFPITTDIHSHILPGIDDGSPDLETSINLIKGLIDLGITKSIATPHIISDLYRNTPETINAALNLIRNELKVQGINFEISAAAEYMMDTYFLELLQNKASLLTISENIILTEFSYASMPDEPSKISFEIQIAGYKPILAHPERYPYYYKNYKMYNKLSDLGFLLQVNLLSLTGYYGKEAAKAAKYMLDNNLVAYLGTDLHHDRHLAALNDERNTKEFYKQLSHRKWNDFI
jgi:tyrosine-protein phosphatase YwqE